MENRIVILGSNGQLGTALTKLCDKKSIEYLALDYPQIDLTRPDSYYEIISKFKPDTLINCAAYTDVYRAERDLERAMLINGTSIKHLVDLCNANEIYLCHISTSYVFNGLKQTPYIETDKPNPVNYYGITKYVGEQILCNYSNDYSIVRTADLYGESLLQFTNIVDKLMSIAKINGSIKLVKDEYSSPTFTGNLAEQILVIVENKLQGIIHATSEGYCNWVEFGEYLFKLLDMNISVKEINSSHLNKNLRKPLNSNLNNTRLKEKNINIMLHWKKALVGYLKTIK